MKGQRIRACHVKLAGMGKARPGGRYNLADRAGIAWKQEKRFLTWQCQRQYRRFRLPEGKSGT